MLRAQAHFDGRGRDDDGLEAEGEDCSSGCRRCREHGYIERGVDQEGHEAEDSPYTKGPCEHGVKYRSKCKVCSACPHGRERSKCKECGGHGICEHGRRRSRCKECGGASNLRARSSALSVQGVRWVINLRARSSALWCKECGGASICEHGRERHKCKECGGGSICEHGRERHRLQGVRWVWNMRARSSAQRVQGVRCKVDYF